MSTASSPLPDVLQAVRAGFIYQNTNLSRWCRENGVSAAYAWTTLQGKHFGRKGVALRRRIIDASGIDEASATTVNKPPPAAQDVEGMEPAR